MTTAEKAKTAEEKKRDELIQTLTIKVFDAIYEKRVLTAEEKALIAESEELAKLMSAFLLKISGSKRYENYGQRSNGISHIYNATHDTQAAFISIRKAIENPHT